MKARANDVQPIRTMAGYASLALPLGALLLAMSVYVPPYLAEHVGIGLAALGVAWSIVRLLDVFIDPLLGMLIDRTVTPLGRYRLWIGIGTPILMVGTWGLFEAAPGLSVTNLTLWLLVFYLGYSIFTVVHSAWGANLATGYNERSRLFSVIAIVMLIGNLLVLVLPVAGSSIGWDTVAAVHATGWLIIALIPSTAVLTSLSAREKPGSVVTAQVPLKRYLSLFRHVHLVRMLLVQFMLTLGPGWSGTLFLFLFTAVWRFTPGQASTLLLIYVLSGFIGAPLTAWIANRIGKHRALMATTMIFSMSLGVMMFLSSAALVVVVPFLSVMGMMNAGFDMMIRSMLADVSDEVKLYESADVASIIFALNSVFNKVALALSVGFSYPLLDWIGFDAKLGAANSASALQGLQALATIGPITFVTLGGLCLIGWRLDRQRHDEIQRMLRAAAGTVQHSPSV